MPRLSLWRPNKGNDYKFFDRRISEMFTVGGVDIHIHKYLGPQEQTGNGTTEPAIPATGITAIQDLLFLENRDRKYDTSVYTLRGVYNVSDNDFDLTQFGLFLTGDTMFMTFHLNDMVEMLGRKIMVGDVFELPNLKDYYPLDDGIPVALKRYYVVQDATRSAEGFSATWYPHLWRVKVAPLVDSQEYKDILNKIPAGDTNNDGVIDENDSTLADLLSTYDKYLEINDAVVSRAEEDVPASGYDTSFIYHLPENNGYPANANVSTSSGKVQGYLTGDALPPNGDTISAGIAFPSSPAVGTYYLRLDYNPNRLFRYDGRRWVKIEDAVRTDLTPGSGNKTQLSGFINNDNAYYKNAIAWDAIKVASPYTPVANAQTQSFTLSTKTIVTKTLWASTHGVKTKLNSTPIPNTLANASGNLSITVSNTLNTDDVLEYTIYANVTPERQTLSSVLRAAADN
jgi:uncharacterized protein YbaR (Trm112 family)